ncbi:MAG: hypothetical protein LW835_08210 [Burkholderiaceae bacterium]|nr:hypothetical protein [Burkholderiaceae bacterium]
MLIAIVKKRANLPHSLYQLLQILSLTMFETTPINQLLTPPPPNGVGIARTPFGLVGS